MSDAAQLRIERHGTVAVARLRGDIDLSNAQALEHELVAAAGTASGLVVDLAGVGYMDSSGLRLLERLARATTGMRIVAPEPSFAADVLRITGLRLEMPVFDSDADALRAAADGG